MPNPEVVIYLHQQSPQFYVRKYVFIRLCDNELQLALQSSGAVLIEGAKWCGKTRTAGNASHSVLFMQDQDSSASNRAMADTKPSLLFKGETLV